MDETHRPDPIKIDSKKLGLIPDWKPKPDVNAGPGTEIYACRSPFFRRML